MILYGGLCDKVVPCEKLCGNSASRTDADWLIARTAWFQLLELLSGKLQNKKTWVHSGEPIKCVYIHSKKSPSTLDDQKLKI